MRGGQKQNCLKLCTLSQLTETLNIDVDKRQDITPEMKVREIWKSKRKEREEVNLQENREEKIPGQTVQDGFNATSHMDDVSGICVQTILWEFKSDVEFRKWLENVEN